MNLIKIARLSHDLAELIQHTRNTLDVIRQTMGMSIQSNPRADAG